MPACTCPADFRLIPAPSPDCDECSPRIVRVARRGARFHMPFAVDELAAAALDRIARAHAKGTFLEACTNVDEWPNAVLQQVRWAKLDLQRAAERRAAREPRAPARDIASDELSMEERYAMQELAKAALDFLSKREGDVVWRRCHGESFVEIGERWNIPANTAGVIYARAINKLARRAWEGWDD